MMLGSWPNIRTSCTVITSIHNDNRSVLESCLNHLLMASCSTETNSMIEVMIFQSGSIVH